MPTPQPNLGNRLYSLLMFLIVSVLCGLLLSGLVVPFAALAGAAATGVATAMERLPANLETPPQAEGTKIQFADGTVIAKLYSEDRTYVPMDKIAPIMRTAQVAIEDDRFYQHGALDFRGTMRALLKSGGEQGGSTITQQYVKQVQIEIAQQNGDKDGVQKAQERTLSRKIQELRYAIAMEKKFSKDQILERYLNIAYYGDQSYGVESAAHHYFNTTADKLTLAQAAMIAGLVQNPTKDPIHQPDSAIERRNVVLSRMLTLHLITQADYDKASAEKFDQALVQQRKPGCVNSPWPFVCDYALKQLNRNPAIGGTPEDAQQNVFSGGFTVTLTLDSDLQQQVQDRIGQVLQPTDPAIATMDLVEPGTGKLLVMAQSRNQMGTMPGQTFYNYNVENAMGGAEGYQAGSTFKIFTTAAALAKGMDPKTTILNSPMEKDMKGQTFLSCNGPKTIAEDYKIENDDKGWGNINMIEAAEHSVNTYFVPLEMQTGVCDPVRYADKAGAKLSMPNPTKGKSLEENGYDTYPSFTLGPAEVTPLSMAAAYATFAARGKYCQPYIIDKIVSRDGKDVSTPKNQCNQAFPENIADATNAVFRMVVENGSGYETWCQPGAYRGDCAAGLGQAGKTGTTNQAQAVWYDGYNPGIAASSMIAVDKTDPFWSGKVQSVRALLNRSTGKKFEGFGNPDCVQFMKIPWWAALKKYGKGDFTAPTPTQAKLVQVPQPYNKPWDQAKLDYIAAGFVVAENDMAKPCTKGNWRVQKTGMQPFGSVIPVDICR